MPAPSLLLNNGVQIPRLGLGVYQSRPGEETYRAVRHALEVGYRHVDTARAYENERDVGRAIQESGVPREQIFITTKLWNSDHGFDATLRACAESRRKLGVEQIDLYLIHWPVAKIRGETWRAMETLLDDGACRAIGVSNYTVRHLDELLASARVVPAVNQVELSPFLHQAELMRYAREHGIALEAYGPLTQGKKLGHPKIREIASKLGRTSAQILLRWAVQHELIVIPKSVRPARIEENARIFDFSLGEAEMQILDQLDEGFRTCWDPTSVP